jgi:hypothetical protein
MREVELLSLTEFGSRLNPRRSRTWVANRITDGTIQAVEHERTGERLIEETEVERYKSGFKPYVPKLQQSHETQPSQPSHTGSD